MQLRVFAVIFLMKYLNQINGAGAWNEPQIFRKNPGNSGLLKIDISTASGVFIRTCLPPES